MFNNIGEKIKILAMVETVIGIVASVITGLVYLTQEAVWLFLVITFGGCLLSWLNSFVLYGFGEIIEQLQESNTHAETRNSLLRNISKKLDVDRAEDAVASSFPTKATTVTENGTEYEVCSLCGAKQPAKGRKRCCKCNAAL